MNPRTVIASGPLVGIQGWLRIEDIPRRTSHARRSVCLASRAASSGSIGPRKAWNADGVDADFLQLVNARPVACLGVPPASRNVAHPIAQGRDAQRSKLAVGLRDEHSSNRV